MGSSTKKAGLTAVTLLNPQLGQGVRKYQQNRKKSKVARAKRDAEWEKKLAEKDSLLVDQEALQSELDAEAQTLSPRELEAAKGSMVSKRKIKKSILADREEYNKSILG